MVSACIDPGATRWFDVDSRCQGFADLERGWCQRFQREQMCSNKTHRLPAFRGAPVDLHLDDLKPARYAFTGTVAQAFLMHREFADAVLPFGQSYFVAGRVYGPSGEIVPDFVSVTALYELPIRGGPSSLRRSCPGCGALLYWPLPHGYSYIVSSSLIVGQGAYIASTGGLVLCEQVLPHINARMRHRMRIEEIPVKDSAEDGIDGFPVLYL